MEKQRFVGIAKCKRRVASPKRSIGNVERGNMDKVKKSHEHVETKWKKYEESV